MMDVVVAEAALDAEPVVIGGTIASVDGDDFLSLHVDGRLTADAAEWAQRIDGTIWLHCARALGVEQVTFHQRARGASLHAFAARHAGRGAHVGVEIEDGPCAGATERHADDVIHLHLPASPHAQAAVDAGIEIDGDGGMAGVGGRTVRGLGQAACRRYTHIVDPLPEFRCLVVAGGALGLVGRQQLEHHFSRLSWPARSPS